MLGHWSRTQATIALSSGEAELNATLKGGCELIGLGVLEEEWGRPVALQLEGDSAACRGTLHRQGAGRQKHLEVRQLWLQDKIRNRSLVFVKVPREINAADTLTKHWSAEAHGHFARLSYAISHADAPCSTEGGCAGIPDRR